MGVSPGAPPCTGGTPIDRRNIPYTMNYYRDAHKLLHKCLGRGGGGRANQNFTPHPSPTPPLFPKALVQSFFLAHHDITNYISVRTLLRRRSERDKGAGVGCGGGEGLRREPTPYARYFVFESLFVGATPYRVLVIPCKGILTSLTTVVDWLIRHNQLQQLLKLLQELRPIQITDRVERPGRDCDCDCDCVIVYLQGWK